MRIPWLQKALRLTSAVGIRAERRDVVVALHLPLEAAQNQPNQTRKNYQEFLKKKDYNINTLRYP